MAVTGLIQQGLFFTALGCIGLLARSQYKRHKELEELKNE